MTSGSNGEAIRAEGIGKTYGPVVALRDINVHLAKGEVLGLIGDNGAGKSTLIKILTGFTQPDQGQIFIDGEEVKLRSVSHARELGIETVYQDLALVNQLPVYANMSLNKEAVHRPIPFLDKQEMRKGPRHISGTWGSAFRRSTPRWASYPGASARRWRSPGPSTPTPR